MALSFCDECVSNWKNNTIMDCDLCKMHLHDGWSIQQMLEVYGNRDVLYDSIGMDKAILYPPMLHRRFLSLQQMQGTNMENLKCYKTQFHLLNKTLQKKLVDIKEDLLKFHTKGNRRQREAFLEQEYFVLHAINNASTEELKRYLFSALDPLSQKILNK